MELKKGHFKISADVLMTALLAFFLVAPGVALPQTPFYQGKTITIIQGRDPGGTGDIRVRALLPFLQKYIPGNPTIVNEYMPGGGSRKAANYIYQSAIPDGLTIGNVGSGMVAVAVLVQDTFLSEMEIGTEICEVLGVDPNLSEAWENLRGLEEKREGKNFLPSRFTGISCEGIIAD